MKRLILFWAVFLILIGCASVPVRIVTLNNSAHYNSKPYNENHNGVGIEFKVPNNYIYGYLNYINSYEVSTNMFTLTTERRCSEYRYKYLYCGWSVGIADGYDNYGIIGGYTVRYKFLRIFITPVLIANGLTSEWYTYE